MDGYYPVGGDNLTTLAGGGINCCVNLPAKWRPDLKYTVLWQEGSGAIDDETTYRYTVQLPEYNETRRHYGGVLPEPSGGIRIR